MLSLYKCARKYGPRVVTGASLVTMAAASFAQAATGDYGAATAISSLQVTVLAIIAGFITMGIAVWGASYILRRFFPKGK